MRNLMKINRALVFALLFIALAGCRKSVGGEESVAQALGEVTLFSAIITTPVEIVEPGVIRPTPRGAIDWYLLSPATR